MRVIVTHALIPHAAVQGGSVATVLHGGGRVFGHYAGHGAPPIAAFILAGYSGLVAFTTAPEPPL